MIFCRNVAIYFNERDKIALFGRLARALERNGVLLVGAMESLSGICPQFESKRPRARGLLSGEESGTRASERPWLRLMAARLRCRRAGCQCAFPGAEDG
ncbi:MAG: CheR family methyltransferase [Candidatus Solibacter sp.]